MAIATPRHIMDAVKDESTRSLPVEVRGTAQFLPVFFLDTVKGDYIKRTVNKAEFDEYYGAESLNPTYEKYTHASEGARSVLTAGGTISVQRIEVNVPPQQVDSAGDGAVVTTKTANVTLYKHDVYIPDAMRYMRYADGSLIYDSTGQPLYVSDTSIGKVASFYSVGYGELEHPLGTEIPSNGVKLGSIFGKVNDDGYTVMSTSIMNFEAVGHGAYYNDISITLAPRLGDDNDIDVYNAGQLQYDMGLIKNVNGKLKSISNNLGMTSVNGVFEKLFAHPVSGNNISLLGRMDTLYGNETNTLYPLSARTLKDIDVHYEAINSRNENILELTEASDIQEMAISGLVSNMPGQVNWVTAKSPDGRPYECFAILPISSEIREFLSGINRTPVDLSNDTPFKLDGGAHIDSNNIDYFETAVVDAIEPYGDINSKEQVIAINKESVFVDTGFGLGNKLMLTKFGNYRKDVLFIGATYSFNETNSSQSLDSALATASALSSTLRMIQESKLYGTSGFRAVILLGDGLPYDGVYPYRVPMTVDFIYKAARQMGASNGVWNQVYAFDRQPNNVIDRLVDIEPKFIPDSAKDALWKAGVIWFDSEDINKWFYTSQQTIYEDDTSILNSFPTAIAMCTIEKELDAIWRHYTGTTMENPVLKLAIESDLSSALDGRFSDNIVVVPTAYYTYDDGLKGYAWHCRVDFYGTNAKTRMASHIVALRK